MSFKLKRHLRLLHCSAAGESGDLDNLKSQAEQDSDSSTVASPQARPKLRHRRHQLEGGHWQTAAEVDRNRDLQVQLTYLFMNTTRAITSSPTSPGKTITVTSTAAGVAYAIVWQWSLPCGRGLPLSGCRRGSVRRVDVRARED
jgi:hypothetical protein